MNTIYVEGLDEVFIKAYLKHLNLEDKAAVQKTDGYTSLFTGAFLNKLDQTRREGGKNIVIFDADSETNGGGFEARLDYLNQKAAEHNLDLNIFLFPNNKSDGDYENLLEELVPDEHKGLLRCFEGYEACVGGHKNPLYRTPNRKNKLHTYIYTFEKSKEEDKLVSKKDYLFNNPEYWNLNSSYLDPLKDFLKEHLL